MTSTAFAGALPKWALPIAEREARGEYRSRWKELDAAFLREHAETPDTAEGEGDYEHLDVKFPHEFASKKAKAFRLSPESDRMLLELAIAAVDARARDQPMLLAVSFSAHDYICHVFGTTSWEEWDELMRLDQALGQFFNDLDARLGTNGWSLLLTADHGGGVMPEAPRAWCGRGRPDPWQRPCEKGGRIDPKALLKRVQDKAHASFGNDDNSVRGEELPFLFLSKKAVALDPSKRDELYKAVRDEAKQVPGVADVFDLAGFAKGSPPGDSIEALICQSTVLDDDAGYYVLQRPGWVYENSCVPGHGLAHGAPYVHDLSVPLFVRAPGGVPAGERIEERIPFTSFARTAATLLGITDFAPGGRDLTMGNRN